MIKRRLPIFFYDMDPGFISDIRTHNGEVITKLRMPSRTRMVMFCKGPRSLGSEVRSPRAYLGSFVAMSAKNFPA